MWGLCLSQQPERAILLCRQVEEAKIMARAEQGDKTAHFMELLGVSVPVPLMGNI